MKVKRFIMALVAVAAISTTAVAQPERPDGPRRNPAEMAKHRTERMVEQYGLDQQQAEKLLELNTKYADKMRPMFGHHGHRHDGRRPEVAERRMPRDDDRRPELTEEQRQKMQQEREEQAKVMASYDEELKAIMTPEQFAKYQDDKKNERKRH